VGWLGLVASGMYLLNQGDILATAVPGFPIWDLAGLLGSTLWAVWLLTLGAMLLPARPYPLGSAAGPRHRGHHHRAIGPARWVRRQRHRRHRQRAAAVNGGARRQADDAARPAASLHRICWDRDVASVSHLA
jgi:hypothetical protein